METYIGLKFIQAEPAPAPDDVKGDSKPGDDGYKVIYPGGYESWSPKAVFEEAYKETFTPGQALDWCNKIIGWVRSESFNDQESVAKALNVFWSAGME